MSTSRSREVHRVDFVQPLRLADLVVRGPQKIRVGDARNLDRILKREEDPLLGAFLGRQRQEILTIVGSRATGHFVRGMASEHLGEGALPGSVGPHDRVDFSSAHSERDAFEDLAIGDAGVQVYDFEHQPTLPSNVIPRSCWASSANSIGKFWKTSLQNPLTIKEMACSALSPRCLQ